LVFSFIGVSPRRFQGPPPRMRRILEGVEMFSSTSLPGFPIWTHFRSPLEAVTAGGGVSDLMRVVTGSASSVVTGCQSGDNPLLERLVTVSPVPKRGGQAGEARWDMAPRVPTGGWPAAYKGARKFKSSPVLRSPIGSRRPRAPRPTLPLRGCPGVSGGAGIKNGSLSEGAEGEGAWRIRSGMMQARSLFEAQASLQRMLVTTPPTDDERAAVDQGADAVDRLLARLADTPTLAGPSPRGHHFTNSSLFRAHFSL